MSWYRTGTVAVTNGSTNVTGTGTAWVGQIIIGSAIHLPDGRAYEVANIVSDTQLTLGSDYLGSTASGQVYAVQPTQGWAQRVNQQVATWIASQQAYLDGPLAGRFGDGTAALPGLAFLADLDTGLRRPGNNRTIIVTGGADRLEVNNAGAILTGLLSGTAVMQSLIDATVGRLMTAGAFGLGVTGSSPQCPDLDATNLAAGTYNVSSTTPNVASRPTGGNQFAVVRVHRYDTERCWQEYFDRADSGGNGLRKWIRGHSSATGWSIWQRDYTANSILGPVSQTGGYPTGAIIERGSNANGEYVRFADGTQICTHTFAQDSDIDMAQGSIFTSTTQNWTFPATFAATPFVPPPGLSASDARWTTGRGVSTTTGQVRQFRGIASATRVDYQAIAIGRWF